MGISYFREQHTEESVSICGLLQNPCLNRLSSLAQSRRHHTSSRQHRWRGGCAESSQTLYRVAASASQTLYRVAASAAAEAPTPALPSQDRMLRSLMAGTASLLAQCWVAARRYSVARIVLACTWWSNGGQQICHHAGPEAQQLLRQRDGATTEAGAAGLGDDLVAANKWWRGSGGRRREIGLGLDVLVDLRRREGAARGLEMDGGFWL
jgi:glutathione S-transferase